MFGRLKTSAMRRPPQQFARASIMRFASFPVSEAVRRRNGLTALVLVVFVGGVYMTVINRIKTSDDFAEILEDEGKK